MEDLAKQALEHFFLILCSIVSFLASPVAQTVKYLPAMQETQVWSLGQEDSLEKEMATHSSILYWRISWTEEPGRLQSMGLQGVRHDWVNNTHSYLFLCLSFFIVKGGPPEFIDRNKWDNAFERLICIMSDGKCSTKSGIVWYHCLAYFDQVERS